ncbi:MAG: cytochrome c oxidase assembly protein [Sphingorhabdus sp.]
MSAASVASANIRTAMMAGALAIAMVGMGFAAVPLYRIFCQVTGFGGTTMRVDEAQAATIQAVGKQITIRFDANQRGLPWEFRPERQSEKVTIGAKEMAIFLAKNLSARPVTGTATFNVSPVQAGQYFTKIQCFCFTEQTLQPGEEVRMPVLFYVDPRILDDPDANDIEEITLSYTFYPVDEDKKGS